MVCVPGIHGPAHELRTKHYGLRLRIVVCVPGIPEVLCLTTRAELLTLRILRMKV